MEHLPDNVVPEREIQIYRDNNDINIDEIRESFQNSIDNFTELVNARISSDPVNYAKAVHAFNTQCKRIINGSDAMLYIWQRVLLISSWHEEKLWENSSPQ